MKAFVYRRKSTDSEDRQVISLDSQFDALKHLHNFNDFTIVKDYQESKSAKQPNNRPKFSEMIERIQNGEAQAILCWHLNRLARNDVEGGQLLWLLRNGLEIVTPHKTYTAIDAMMATIEFGMSSQFIQDLRIATKRGVDEKLKRGHAPILAPLGYRNDITKPQGLRDILPDTNFSLVRSLWDMMLTGNYSVAAVFKKAEELGVHYANGRTVSKTKIYLLFSDIFYTGKFIYAKKEYQGSHKPMVTIDEFERVQRLLGNTPTTSTHEFSYTNWLRCGSCDSTITAHERYRKICTNCHHKFNALTNAVCPKCKAALPEKTSYFCYYHCTKKKNSECPESAITLKEIEKQIDKKLSELTIHPDFAKWALGVLQRVHKEESEKRESIEQSLTTSASFIKKKLTQLTDKYLSPDNVDGQIFSNEEYIRKKQQFNEELKKVEENQKGETYHLQNWLEVAESAMTFATYARQWFNSGTKIQKKFVIRAIGLNPTLKNGLVNFGNLEPFESIIQLKKATTKEQKTLEPEDQLQNEAKQPKSLIVGG